MAGLLVGHFDDESSAASDRLRRSVQTEFRVGSGMIRDSDMSECPSGCVVFSNWRHASTSAYAAGKNILPPPRNVK